MEDDDYESSPSGSLLSVALAVLAIVLGGAGLYFGLTANQRLSPLADTLEAGSSSAARLEKEISGLKTQIAELSARSADLVRTIDRVKAYGNTNERAVKAVASSVVDNRDEIVELAGRINEVIAGGVQPAVVAASTSATTSTTPTLGSAASGAETADTYTIASGDTLTGIASKLGVGLQALLDANPDADPRRLSIGQAIKVPSN